MAVDEAILRAVAAGLALPTLRFYAWEPPCLSLGRAQQASDVDLNALRATGFDLVRRPTGGKATRVSWRRPSSPKGTRLSTVCPGPTF
jgi:lipoate-protein ligase A